MRDMKNKKPLVRKAMKEALKDMVPEVEKLRNEKPTERGWCDYTWNSFHDTWVVAPSHLNDSEIVRLNNELGLNTNEGINKWYK